VDGANTVGYRAIATPGALKGWAHAVERYGCLPLARLVEPAIRFATSGFTVSAYLVNLSAELVGGHGQPHRQGRS
jgi:gamma-glutamyltranspeptidase/glutathione hydrolase